MVPTPNQNHWKAIRTLYPLYEQKLCAGKDTMLILHGDLSGHLTVERVEQVTSFESPAKLAKWLHLAVHDPTSVGVHCITELETIAKRVPLDELEELLYAIYDRDEVIELYREDLGLITIGYNSDTSLWYADSWTAQADLSAQFSLSDVVADVMNILSEAAEGSLNDQDA